MWSSSSLRPTLHYLVESCCTVELIYHEQLCYCVCMHACVCELVLMWFELSGSLAALVGMRVFLFKHYEMLRAPTLVLSGSRS